MSDTAQELRAMLDAIDEPDPTPREARARLNELCTKEIHSDWRRKLMEHDPLAGLENARLRKVIAVDDIRKKIREMAGSP